MSGWEFQINTPGAKPKSTSRWGTGCMILFGLPFAGFGVLALVQAVRELAAGRLREAGFLSIFVLVFGGVGVGIMIAAVAGGRKQRRQEALCAQHPDAPWKWREDWAEGVVKSNNRAKLILAWCAALFWNGVSSVAVIQLPKELAKGNKAALFALVFPLFGVVLVGWAIHTTLAWRRFGLSLFRMKHTPGVLGGTLEGMIEANARLQAADGIQVRLACVHRVTTGSGKNSSTSETVLWEDEKRLTSDLPEHRAQMTDIPVFFRIPFEPPASREDNPRDRVEWRLEARAKVPGPDYVAAFEVPVFKTAASRPGANLVADPTAPYQMPFTERRPAKPSRIRVSDTASGGREFYFPAARHPGTAIGVTLFWLLWTGGVWLMIRFKFPLLFPIVFGLLEILIAWLWLRVLVRSSRVVVSAEGIEWSTRWLGLGRTRRLSAAEVARFQTRTGMTSGKTVFQDLVLVTASRKEIVLAMDISDFQEARWLIEEMKKALGRP